MRSLLVLPITISIFFGHSFAGGNAFATPKDECVEAHSRGQDLRDKGQLSRARHRS